MNENKKITIITSQFPVLSETFVVNQIKELDRQGHHVEVISLFGSKKLTGTDLDKFIEKTHFITHLDPKTCTAKDKLIQIIKNAYKFIGLKNKYELVKETYLLLKDKNYSAILNNWLLVLSMGNTIKADFSIAHFFPNGCYAEFLRLSGRLETRKLATICHGNDMSHKSLLASWLPYYKRTLQRTDYLWPISDFWKSRLLEWGAKEESIQVVRMGINSQQLTFTARESAIELPIKVLSVGRATEKKGLLYAVKALSQLDFVEYQIIGDGEGLVDLQAEIKASGCTNIKCLGSLPHEEVLKHLEQSDVFLLPSVTAEDGDMEGIPVALMEAMAKGKLVVSTYHSGIPELITDKKSGFLCEERNEQEIINAFLTMKDMPLELLNLTLLNARDKVESQFNNKNIIKSIGNFIND